MKKLISIVGARPQFVKAAMLSHAIQKSDFVEEVMVHTGQHYDHNMSGSFFSDLEIPQPKYNLEISENLHGAMTGKMIADLEDVFLKEKPDGVIVYGDTNSTLAGAIAAVKLHIPIFHIEAGLRSFNKKMPEEINRILTDNVSSLLFCPTNTAVHNLKNEGITEGVHMVGDIMYDASLFALEKAKQTSHILKTLGVEEKNYSIATLHRAENTDDEEKLKEIFSFLEESSINIPMIMPLHPRTKKQMKKYGIKPKNIRLIEPLGYFDMTLLTSGAQAVYTDSGGLQKEAYFHRVPCVTLRDETEWIETIDCGWNRLWTEESYLPRKEILDYGHGGCAKTILDQLAQ